MKLVVTVFLDFFFFFFYQGQLGNRNKLVDVITMLEMLLLLVAVVVCSNYTATLDSKGDNVFLLQKTFATAVKNTLL